MSDNAKDQLARWLPTVIAIAAIIGNILWLGARAGALEERINYTQATAAAAVTRLEYQADRSATATSLSEMRQSLRDISAKLDRLVEHR
jgi:uncharacterized protein with beta-barrel porin domain